MPSWRRRRRRSGGPRSTSPTSPRRPPRTDGLVADVDPLNRTVDRVIDTGTVPIPEEPGNFDNPDEVGPARTSLRPIEITQPEGPSFTVDADRVVSWEGWRISVGFDAREGLVLRRIGFVDGGRLRPIIHRASI